MPKVYAPQQPSRFDSAFNMWVPLFPMTEARKFGELVVMLPPNYSSTMGAPLVQAIKERMNDFTEEDYLIAVGDPTLIAAAAGIAFRKTGGRLKLLKWDRHTKDYLVVELSL